MTHNLVAAYGMLPKMTTLVRICAGFYQIAFTVTDLAYLLQRPRRSTPEEMTAFHTDEYINFLAKVSPETAEDLTLSGTRC